MVLLPNNYVSSHYNAQKETALQNTSEFTICDADDEANHGGLGTNVAEAF